MHVRFCGSNAKQEASMQLRQPNIAEMELMLQPENSEFRAKPQLLLPNYSVRARARLRHQLLQKEIELLRVRLDIIQDRAKVVVRSGAAWANASARSQLGPYPWAKFVGIALGSFLVTNALRKLPLGSVVAATIPLIMVAVERRKARDG
jgi:hypothetical protein